MVMKFILRYVSVTCLARSRRCGTRRVPALPWKYSITGCFGSLRNSQSIARPGMDADTHRSALSKASSDRTSSSSCALLIACGRTCQVPSCTPSGVLMKKFRTRFAGMLHVSPDYRAKTVAYERSLICVSDDETSELAEISASIYQGTPYASGQLYFAWRVPASAPSHA